MKRLILFLITIFSFFIGSPVYAAIGVTQQPSIGVQVKGQDSGHLVGNIIRNVTVLIFSVGAVAFVIIFLWGAVEWILSGGDKEKVAGARKRITSALIGLALLSLTYVILAILGQVLSINFFGDFQIPQFNSPPRDTTGTNGPL